MQAPFGIKQMRAMLKGDDLEADDIFKAMVTDGD